MSEKTQRGIDHLVLPASDLDALGAFYEKLGFVVGTENRHPFGTKNMIIQVPGTFLELISVYSEDLFPELPSLAFNFPEFQKTYLDDVGDGFSMLVLESSDAAADRADYLSAGINVHDPFSFSRLATLPDGSKAEVGFNLTFVTDPNMPKAAFFTCEQWRPDLFWKKEFQAHPNGATAICEVVMVSEEPQNHQGFHSAFSGCDFEEIEGGIKGDTPRGTVSVLTPEKVTSLFGIGTMGALPGLAGFVVQTSDLTKAAAIFDENDISYATVDDLLVIDPTRSFGTLIGFRAV